MRKIILLLSVVLTLSSCYTTSMQGSPAAVSAGASIGGVLGSIVGDRAGGWNGSQFGAFVGTVAGEAVHPGRCFLELGFGTDWIISRTWTADAGYMLDVRDAAVEHQLHIGASHSF